MLEVVVGEVFLVLSRTGNQPRPPHKKRRGSLVNRRGVKVSAVRHRCVSPTRKGART